jgi:hypothetical protein
MRPTSDSGSVDIGDLARYARVLMDGRAALEATVRFGRRHLGPVKWDPAPGAEAAAELANTEVRQNGDPWGENPPRTAYAAANLMMTGVLDNLASIHNLLAIEMPVIGPTVLARSTIEIASGAWWLMEPGIGARKRVCRELALSLESARRAGQVAKEFQDTGFPVGPEITEALQQEAKVLDRIKEYGITPPTSTGYSPTIETEKTASATAATSELLKAALPGSVPGTSFYRTYSAVTHGEFYGLMNFMEHGVAADGSKLLSWGRPPAGILDSTVQIAITAFGQAYRRINTVMGWGKLERDLWEIKLQKIYN